MTKQIVIGWLYPELMSTYGDRGNILVLQKLAEWNGIKASVKRISQDTNYKEIEECDLLFMGGAQDIQQEIVNKDLLSKKGEKIGQRILDNTPALFICGAYQFLGKYYKDAYGVKIDGLGLFDMFTESPEISDRLIGNVVAKINHPMSLNETTDTNYIVGFENHGGRTYLKNPEESFATIIKGHGNNGKDKTEGIQYKNAIGTYFHGPLLPANPDLGVHLLQLAISNKYNKKVNLVNKDKYAEKAKVVMLRSVVNKP